MATFPNDQFDNLPENLDRVGAHRGPKVKGRGWIGFLWAVLATAILVVAGLFVLQTMNGQFNFTGTVAEPSNTPVASPTPTITPITDPTTIKSRHITIAILNGTPTSGLQGTASKVLKAAKWKVVSTAVASENTIKKTVVYYNSKADKDVALGVAAALGKATVQQTDVFPANPITVVLGSDYTG